MTECFGQKRMHFFGIFEANTYFSTSKASKREFANKPQGLLCLVFSVVKRLFLCFIFLAAV